MPDPLDRFRRLLHHAAGARHQRSEEDEAAGELRSDRADLSQPDSAEQALLGARSTLDTPYGRVQVLDKRLETAIPYAPTLMSRVLLPEVTAGAAWLKDERLRGFVRDGALFLDVETTGG
ncbi:MAG: hypothetical protein FJ109_20645, partial [Deltaproteobacteria bacterium]|nr:hypothetical protein [Deltaproteobacteria bacterium]